MEDRKEIGGYFRDQIVEKEISVSPSNTVWNSIEQTLKKKKRRRVVIILLSLLLSITIITISYKSVNNYFKNQESLQKINVIQKALPKKKSTPLTNDEKNISSINSLIDSVSSDSTSLKLLSNKSFLQSIKKEKRPTNTKSNRIIKSNNLKGNKNSIREIFNKKEVIKSQELPSKVFNKTPHLNTKDSIEEKVGDNQKNKFNKETNINDKDTNLDKVSLSINGGPIYFTNLANNYPLFNTKLDRKTTSDISFSFGVSLNIALSKKTELSLGLNIINYRYTVNSSTIEVNEFGQINVINNNRVQYFSNTLNENDINLINTEENLTIRHKTSYFEVPIELSHQLKLKKLNFRLIGGMSLYVLNENTISLQTSNFGATDVGYANFLNNLSFGTHIGIGFQPFTLNHVQLHIKPILRYQFNASKTVDNFNPFYFGITTDLKFKL